MNPHTIVNLKNFLENLNKKNLHLHIDIMSAETLERCVVLAWTLYIVLHLLSSVTMTRC